MNIHHQIKFKSSIRIGGSSDPDNRNPFCNFRTDQHARLKKLISRGAYDKEDMLNKLDVFLMANRITEEQYQELVGMME